MKRTTLFLIIYSFCFINLFCSISLAQESKPCGQPWNTPLFTVTGEIVDIYFATPYWTAEEGLHLAVKTSSDSSVVIHVFPKECIDRDPGKYQFSVGERISVTGSDFYSEGGAQRNICAAKIEQRPDLALRNLQTGCLNEELCRNCQGFCDDLCSNRANTEICINICLGNCKATITPCPEVIDSFILPTSIQSLLLKN